ncbi:MAG: cytochrome c maturation protein CcmE [Gemmatimonas sp.]
MTRKSRRLALIVALLLVVAGTATLALVAFRSSVVFFVAPSEIAASGDANAGKALRLGGLVEDGSVRKAGNDVRFRVTDGKAAVEVHYVGILPDLFREGQGVVAEGRLTPGRTFEATQVLAKHDERYMPPEAVEALKRSGEWRGN